mmetsp:Transcript_3549/g.9789  ORF Transcript_3549/g.9789 Transcript_3549/m.9789 type:complete len:225 (-) Transcript_3549:474-1148(-)
MIMTMRLLRGIFLGLLYASGSDIQVQAFSSLSQSTTTTTNAMARCSTTRALQQQDQQRQPESFSTPTQLPAAAAPDLDTIALVVGQENYGLALVALGEGIYSFVQAPSWANIKVLIPPVLAAGVLVAVAGPLIVTAPSSGDNANDVALGLWIATAVSTGLGASYVLRLLAPPSDTFVPKEVAFLGLLVSLAGFFSFSQNLIVDGFVTLPQLPQLLEMPPSDNGV